MLAPAPLHTVGRPFDAPQGRRDKALRAAEVFHSEPDFLKQVSFQFWKSDDTIEMGFSESLIGGAMGILRRSGTQVKQSGATSVTVAC